MITSRPLANGANWPGIAVEGRTFSRAGSGEDVWDASPERSSPASPASVSPSGKNVNLAMEAKIAASKSAQSDRSDPLNVPLLVSAIGPRPSGPNQRSQSQLLPQKSQGSQGSQRAHRAPVPSSHVLRSAGSLCADATR